jgi:hypothetical protein
MARFYFHLRDGTDELLDEEGREFPDKEAVRTTFAKPLGTS